VPVPVQEPSSAPGELPLERGQPGPVGEDLPQAVSCKDLQDRSAQQGLGAELHHGGAEIHAGLDPDRRGLRLGVDDLNTGQ